MKWRSFRWKEYHWVVPFQCQSTVLYCKMQVLTFIFKSNSPINLWIEFYSFRFQLHMSTANSIHQLPLYSFSVGGKAILSFYLIYLNLVKTHKLSIEIQFKYYVSRSRLWWWECRNDVCLKSTFSKTRKFGRSYKKFLQKLCVEECRDALHRDSIYCKNILLFNHF